MASLWTTLDAERGVWLHEYAIPSGVKANCVAVKLGDGKLMVVSPAYGATAALFAELESHGKIVALVAPNLGHDRGQLEWQKRYPEARCFAPSASIAKIAKAKPQLRPFEPPSALAPLLPAHIQLDDPPGVKAGALGLLIERKSGWLYYLDEIVSNMAELQGPLPFKLAFKWTNSAPGFKLNRLFRMVFISDKTGARNHLLDVVAKHDVSMFVPGHGAPIERAGLSAELSTLVQAL